MKEFELSSGQRISPILIAVGLAIMAAAWQSLEGEWRRWLLLPVTAFWASIVTPHISAWFVDTVATAIQMWRAQEAEEAKEEPTPSPVPISTEMPAALSDSDARALRALSMVTDLLNRAIRACGPDDHRIPRYDDCLDANGEPLSGRKWEEATLILRRAGYVRVDDDGTYLPAHTLGELYGMLWRGEAVLPPYPIESGAAQAAPEQRNTEQAGAGG